MDRRREQRTALHELGVGVGAMPLNVEEDPALAEDRDVLAASRRRQATRPSGGAMFACFSLTTLSDGHRAAEALQLEVPDVLGFHQVVHHP